MRLFYSDRKTGERKFRPFVGANIPIIPDSWYHVCMGLDTVSGLLRVVVNGKVVTDEEEEYFKNTEDLKPSTVAGNFIGI